MEKSEATIKQYEAMVKGEIRDLVYDPTSLLEHIKDKTTHTQKNILCACKWKYEEHIRDMVKKYREGLKVYEMAIEKVNNDIINSKIPNTNKFNKIPWNVYEPSGYTKRDIIGVVYSWFPPRRCDYVYMYYDKEYDNKDKNFYYDGYFVFNKYKTCKKYGQQIIKLGDDLCDYINKYIEHNGIKMGDKLIKLGYSQYKRIILDVFNTSVDGLRHSYITHIYKNKNNLFTIKDTSYKMAHDITTHLTYIDKDNDN